MDNNRIVYRAGMIGSPVSTDTEWSDGNLSELKKLGFNALQLNIAWGCRPGGEPLNLEDVIIQNDLDEIRTVTHTSEKIRYRLGKCKEHGFRSIFHFGAPFNGHAGYMGDPLEKCISDKAVHDYYTALIGMLAEQIPGIDDLLVYTYDQDAWLCSEAGGCESCWGVPLHKRLPPFLRRLTEAWHEVNPDGRVWWEPWELSAGQALKMIEYLPKEHFGLCLHSNTGEVQKTRPVDLWFANMVTMAKSRNIPVIAELFLAEASEETEPLESIPCPQLTYSQMHAVLRFDGVIGIKEYYGLVPGKGDPCLQMAGKVLCNPTKPLEECMTEIADELGFKSVSGEVIAFWDQVSRGYQLFPWDVSWFAREVGRADPDHGWKAAFLRGQQCSTPSWESSRHSIFMKTDNLQPHFWMLEDIQLRCGLAVQTLNVAIGMAKSILPKLASRQRVSIDQSVSSLIYFARICKSYELHLRETNIAWLIRENPDAGIANALIREMEILLQDDCVNQENTKRVAAIKDEFVHDPRSWFKNYLLEDVSATGDITATEKGIFSLTTR